MSPLEQQEAIDRADILRCVRDLTAAVQDQTEMLRQVRESLSDLAAAIEKQRLYGSR